MFTRIDSCSTRSYRRAETGRRRQPFLPTLVASVAVSAMAGLWPGATPPASGQVTTGQTPANDANGADAGQASATTSTTASPQDLLRHVFARYESPRLNSFTATVRHHDSSGLFPGDYEQQLQWRRGEQLNGKDGRFVLRVTSPPGGNVVTTEMGQKVPDYYCDGGRIVTDQPDGARYINLPGVQPNSSPGWEVSGGPIVSALMRSPNRGFFRGEFPAGAAAAGLSLSYGPRTLWQGQRVREVLVTAVGPDSKPGRLSLFVDARGERFVGYEAETGRRSAPTLGYEVYTDQKFNPPLPTSLGTAPPAKKGAKVVDLSATE